VVVSHARHAPLMESDGIHVQAVRLTFQLINLAQNVSQFVLLENILNRLEMIGLSAMTVMTNQIAKDVIQMIQQFA
jgi:hypothetical protein